MHEEPFRDNGTTALSTLLFPMACATPQQLSTALNLLQAQINCIVSESPFMVITQGLQLT